MKTLLKQAPVLLLATLSIGCFSYKPYLNAPAPASTMRVELNEAGTEILATTLGGNVRRVDGQYVEQRGDTLRLLVSSLLTRDNRTLYMRGATVSLPASAIETAGVRTLDKGRTVIATVIAGAAAMGLVAGVQQGGGGSGNLPPGPIPVPAMRIPR